MAVPLVPVAAVGGMALSSIAKAVAVLYGAGSDLNDFANRHLQEMQASDNTSIATTGRILEMAKQGFGLGYVSSVAIIAVGQYLLGNTFSALTTVATAATLSNPIAMTCAAVGAIIYGWMALNDAERKSILDSLAHGLEIGVELIKSMVAFVINTAKELLSSQTLKELKTFISEKAAVFGRSLSDVTHSTVDALRDAASTVKVHAEVALASTTKVAEEASGVLGEKLTDLSKKAGQALDQTGNAAKQMLADGRVAFRRSRSNEPNK